jgi:hypothetical protein
MMEAQDSYRRISDTIGNSKPGAEAYQAKKAIAEPSRNLCSTSRFSKEKIDVSALKAQFQAATVMFSLFTVRHIHCV